ncbi:NADPH-dependent FMN reductase [Paenibacillus qinlingensis]|uniref:NAD(P)H-dependent FMN reductase n=1 Tax=Paenibacillus qinlingensis TaxID=1837343 RepID=A0ABU1P4J4_9BACL|nr:NADPH-dependent FMN reductase [Paenibacillus qinlingensis]MDR6554504.1 NAD(P)H-dependent FMN reductase [Paenibacillus qinlingensis]
MKITIVAGSNHSAATSTRLAAYIQHLAMQEQHDVALLDLFRTPLPFYSPEVEGDTHPALEAFKRAMLSADAIVLATPEYHSGMSGVLKNALDHVGQDHFKNKAVLSISSSGGAVAVSSLTQMQTTVRNLHGINCPEWISIGGDQRKSFRVDASFEDIQPDIDKRIRRVVGSFLTLAEQLSGRA